MPRSTDDATPAPPVPFGVRTRLTPDELLATARRTAPRFGNPRAEPLPDGRVLLELHGTHRTVSAASAYDDATMAGTWANMTATRMAAAA